MTKEKKLEFLKRQLLMHLHKLKLVYLILIQEHLDGTQIHNQNQILVEISYLLTVSVIPGLQERWFGLIKKRILVLL
jgi:hypothetical protein